MAWTPRPTLLLPVIVVGALAAPAHAEGERALSGSLSWATFSAPGKAEKPNMEPPALNPTVGGTAAGIYEHSLGSDFSLRGEVAGSLFYGGAQKNQTTEVSYAGLVDAGALFRFDVLKYVPYAFGGIGGMFTAGGPIGNHADFVLVVGGGLDVLVSREHSWGVEARLASFGGDVTVFTVGLRATARWGYF